MSAEVPYDPDDTVESAFITRENFGYTLRAERKTGGTKHVTAIDLVYLNGQEICLPDDIGQVLKLADVRLSVYEADDLRRLRMTQSI